MPEQTRFPAAWPLLLLLLIGFSTLASAQTNCFPNPISAPIGNVSLSNGHTMRGLKGSVGTPPQNFAFLPQWPLNSTFVYGINGMCESKYTAASCVTFRGGQYSSLQSSSRKAVDTNARPDSSPYPSYELFNDTLALGDGVELDDFPIGTPLNDWGSQGYHPQAALGLGAGSTLLGTLKAGGKIASRTWAFFWGRTGAASSTQLEGSLVLGGYDKAKVVGANYTDLLGSPGTCSTGIAPTISDLVLNFPNGTNASLFVGKSTLLSACIVPDYPVIMTIPTDPYFDRFQELTQTTLRERSFGPNFFSVRYSAGDAPFGGDLTIKFTSGLAIRIPNDQLVVPDLSFASSGELVANATGPNLVLLPMQDVNANDLVQLGRQFLSAAYLMVNQEAESYTLWAANPTSKEDLVPIDGTNVERKGTDLACPAVPDATPSTRPNSDDSPDAESPVPDPGRSGLGAGPIAGIAVGSVAGGALLAVVALYLLRRRRHHPATTVPNFEGNAVPGFEAKSPPSSWAPPSELQSETPLSFFLKSPPPIELPNRPRYELGG